MDEADESNFRPRPYQDQILNYVLKNNSIVYLPTGSGKTFIAIMAIKHYSKDLAGSLKDGAKRSVFLCNTVALAKQQAAVIQRAVNLKCVVYTGDQNVDNWKREKWETEFETYQVLVATVQIILDVVRHGFIKITDFNLMVFDECHHATNNHPMFQLLSQFQYYPQSQLPRVVGLTGILTKFSTQQKIIRDLDDLEAKFRGKIVTVLNIEEFKNVLIYSTKPQEIIIKYHEFPSNSIIKETIEKRVKECQLISTSLIVDEKRQDDIKKPLSHIIKMWNDFIYQMNDMGIYAASIAIMSLLVDFETKKRCSETIAQRNLYRISISYAERIRHLIVEEMYDTSDEDETEESVILDYSTSKLQAFISYMKKEFSNKKSSDIKCLVFVQRRRTAKCLYHIIKRYSTCNNNFPITPEFMVGANSPMPESIEYILEQKWDRNILNAFKKNECNLIVSTSVLEEGIDIQSCNYVIIFDNLKCFTSYLQTKGRARMEESTYALMVSENAKETILRKINEYKIADKLLKDYLIGKTIDRTIPTNEQISEQFKDVIKPFHSKIGARLEAHSAIQLLNRYCMTLPNDNFTLSNIDWELEKKIIDKETKCFVKINLPLQSTIKETIISDAMPSPNWAKKSAAFKACVQLYHNKEFGENLLPISKRTLEEKVQISYFKHWENFSTDNPALAGTTKLKRLHKIRYPSNTTAALPKPNITAYIYVIKLTPSFNRDDENAHVLDLLNTSSFYAILTSKPLPKVAAMPFFMTQGMVIADIVSTPIITNIPSEDDLKCLRNFHVMLFRDILKTWKSFLANDYRNEENSYLIVPTKNGTEIDWELVRNFQKLNRDTIKPNMNIISSDYENRVVCTRYTSDDTTRYVVRKIREDLTPFSPFPNSSYESFAHYVYDKYKEKVNNRNQFLIEVKPITSRVNFLTTGAGVAGAKKKTKKLDDILLIPELCYNFHYPGDMWLKAVLIPSVLHRLHYLLLAEELRVNILSYLKLEYPNYAPEQVIVDSNLKRVNKFDCKDEIKAPVFPNPENTVSKQVDSNERYVESTNKWKTYEEPCDLVRNLDNLFKIELDYYHQFITTNLANMKLDDKNNDNDDDIPSFMASESVSAICDTPVVDKFKINILEIPDIPTKSPEQWEFLCALTASSTGDVFDMERHELLGDSFLKFSISLYLLQKHPKWHEGFLTSIKGKFVSNQNLLYCAIKNDIPGRINITTFDPRAEWQPPLISVPKNAVELVLKNNASPTAFWDLILSTNEIETGECRNETLNELYTHFANKPPPIESSLNTFTGYHIVADKVPADCMEAILGVCLKNFGIERTFSLLELFNICPPNENLSNLLKVNIGDPRVKTNITDKEVDEFLINYKDLEKNLGYTFRNRAYLLQALTHPSFPTNRLTGCYQQLEFLGDAVLDFLISCYIFERCQDMDPGKLTDLRSALVNNITLACVTVRNNFHLFLLSQNSKLMQTITNFYNFQKDNNFEVNDQVRLLIQENETNQYIADCIDVPKALGDIFESLIGAVYLDSGNNINVTWKVIYGLLSKEIENFMRRVPLQVVRQLHEYKGAGPVYSDPIVDEDNVLVKCKFTCRNEIREVCGFGQNKEQAKTAASKLALQCLSQA